MINLNVHWLDRWQWWHRIHPSAYAKGTIIRGDPHGVLEVYKNQGSGQLRVYSGDNLDGQAISVNGEPAQTLRSAGRHGKLYLGHKEDV